MSARRAYRRFKGDVPDDMKWCPECAKTLPKSMFLVRKRGHLETYCDECRVVRTIAYKLKIPVAQAKSLRAIGFCAICGTDNPWPKGHFYIDHCHTTGLVRGVLCCNCNAFLGKANDDPAILRAAVEYLETRTQ